MVTAVKLAVFFWGVARGSVAFVWACSGACSGVSSGACSGTCSGTCWGFLALAVARWMLLPPWRILPFDLYVDASDNSPHLPVPRIRHIATCAKLLGTSMCAHFLGTSVRTSSAMQRCWHGTELRGYHGPMLSKRHMVRRQKKGSISMPSLRSDGTASARATAQQMTRTRASSSCVLTVQVFASGKDSLSFSMTSCISKPFVYSLDRSSIRLVRLGSTPWRWPSWVPGVPAVATTTIFPRSESPYDIFVSAWQGSSS